MFAIIAAQTLLIIAFGEILPKVLGEARPERIALMTAPALGVVRRVLLPLVWLVNHLISWARPSRPGARGEETEIRALALMGHEGGHIALEEADLIHRVFRLDDITAEDVMTPRALVRGFDADAPLDTLQAALLEANHSQFPIYEGDLDKVVGVLWLRDALGALVSGEGGKTLREVMRPAMFVPQSRTVDDVLRDLQTSHRRVAVVIDEYGITLGILTMDDLVEELVGEAIDETDVSEGLVKRVSKGSALVHGLTRVSDAARLLKCTVVYASPEDETNTVTGLLQERLERIPQVGDTLDLPGGLSLEVRVADARMALRVLARNTARQTQAGPGGPAHP
jgi:CBS domain containing-hemolysin-like protein